MGVSTLLVVLNLAASFRDTPIEQRCEALSSFVASRGFEPKGCSEGNGVGGAQYVLFFDGKAKDGLPKKYRLMTTFEGDGPAEIKLCDAGKTPLECKEKLQEVLPTAQTWIQEKPSSKRIYGLSYGDFMREIIAYKGRYPTTIDGKTGLVKFKLTPDGGPTTGRVTFEPPVDGDFLKCLDCSDVKCLNEELRYRFDDRLFSLTKTGKGKPAEDPPASENYGVGWVIKGPTPLSASGAWDFVCGVTRYSLESVNL